MVLILERNWDTFSFVPWMNGISKTTDFENVLEYLKEEFKFNPYFL